MHWDLIRNIVYEKNSWDNFWKSIEQLCPSKRSALSFPFLSFPFHSIRLFPFLLVPSVFCFYFQPFISFSHFHLPSCSSFPSFLSFPSVILIPCHPSLPLFRFLPVFLSVLPAFLNYFLSFPFLASSYSYLESAAWAESSKPALATTGKHVSGRAVLVPEAATKRRTKAN